MAKDCYYFKHDANARRDAKILALRKKYGNVAYGNYWIIVEEMRESSNYKIEDKDYSWASLSDQLNMTVDEAKNFINDCIDNFNLFERDEGFFYSASLLKRMAELDAKRMQKVYAGEKSGEARRKRGEWD